jgi:Spy/CpxP family protein refolding chaperone
MKSKLIALLAGSALAVSSAAALADGKECDSKKHDKGNKEMSVEMKKEHGWKAEGHDKAADKSADTDAAVKS